MFVSTSYAESASASSVAPAVPVGTEDYDLLVALVWALSLPSETSTGWTFQGRTGQYALFTKIALSESGTYSFSQSVPSKIRAQICAYRGVAKATDPVDAVSNTAYTSNNTTLRAASLTASAVDSTILFVGGCYDTTERTFTPPTNPGTFDEDVDDGGLNPDIWMIFASYQWSGSGATGNIDATIDVALTAKHAFALVLNPPLYADLEGGTVALTGGEPVAALSADVDGGTVALTGSSTTASAGMMITIDGGTVSLTGFDVTEDIDVEYTTRLNNYLLTAEHNERLEGLIRMVVLAMADSNQIIDKLQNRRHLGDASGVWLDILGDIVGTERPLKELADEDYFVFGETYVGAPPTYDNGFANLAQTTGGKLRSLSGNYLDGVTAVSDEDYETLIRAKAESTFRGSALKDIADYIYNAFGITAYAWIDSLSDWHIELDEFLSTKKRQYLVKYAPVPAGSTIMIDNWPEEI